MADWFSDVEVFAAYYSAGQWSVVAPAVRELSGRHGIRRIARCRNEAFGSSERPSAIIRFCDRYGCAARVVPCRSASQLAGRRR
jgi:hypothetical protein